VTRANEAPVHTLGALLEIFASQAQAQLDHLFAKID
jgi:hypothetical protein